MAFRKTNKQQSVPDSPEKLILELPRRNIPGALLHQGESMRKYAQCALDKPDVAIQLPTGSGKTLVGLMIAEWRRRKFKERVLYLCPTKQLVNQVVEQANEKYGLIVNGFTGSSHEYNPIQKTHYQSAERVAVTTYSSLFNTNPFFSNPQTIIIDDVHTAENYIASLWSLHIEKNNPDHSSLHAALCSLLKSHLNILDYQRLSGVSQSLSDATWVDKIPTPTFCELHNDFINIVDTHVEELNIRYEWAMLKDSLHGCHLYVSSKDILLRPIIPPTWSHAPFENAKQRIFMSATLGAGGDLERLTGRKNICRLPVPEGWDKQGIGRRFFIFPTLSLDDAAVLSLRKDMMDKAGRSVVLVPNDKKRKKVVQNINSDEFNVFDADQIEQSKKPFIESEKAVAVMANRYDGIDFPRDDCRVLFIDGLPRVTNSQENFLMTRMTANVLFNERLRTRVLQAIGRCTRSLEDYSAVILSGEHLPEYLLDNEKRGYLHPELQAELKFGVEQSKQCEASEMLENLETFLENGEQWEKANDNILQLREKATARCFPVVNELSSAVNKEIDYQKAICGGDFIEALAAAELVLGKLDAPELKGYRALWYYLAGSACWLFYKEGNASYESRARAYFKKAKQATSGLAWLSKLSSFTLEAPKIEEQDGSIIDKQVERIEAVLVELGTLHMKKFEAREKEIMDGLNNVSTFENAHKLLGEIIGFDAGKEESEGSPDPWWIIDDLCFVFEDHAGAENNSKLNTTKARQTVSHPSWIRQNLNIDDKAEIITVLVSPVSEASKGAMPHLPHFYYWELNDFIGWAKNALAVVRELRKTFKESGDLVWRMEARSELTVKGIDAISIKNLVKANPACKRLSAK